MTPSETSDSPRVGAMLVIAGGGVPRGEPLDAEVGVRQDFHGCTLLIKLSPETEWELTLSDDAGAFLAGYLAGASGVKFG